MILDLGTEGVNLLVDDQILPLWLNEVYNRSMGVAENNRQYDDLDVGVVGYKILWPIKNDIW